MVTFISCQIWKKFCRTNMVVHALKQYWGLSLGTGPLRCDCYSEFFFTVCIENVGHKNWNGFQGHKNIQVRFLFKSAIGTEGSLCLFCFCYCQQELDFLVNLICSSLFVSFLVSLLRVAFLIAIDNLSMNLTFAAPFKFDILVLLLLGIICSVFPLLKVFLWKKANW